MIGEGVKRGPPIHQRQPRSIPEKSYKPFYYGIGVANSSEPMQVMGW
jgi:hypothetical protein